MAMLCVIALIGILNVVLGLASLSRQGTIMAQIDDLQAALNTISTQADTLQTDFTNLETELTNLQNTTPPEVDLSGVIAQAQAISTKLGAIADAANPAPPAA